MNHKTAQSIVDSHGLSPTESLFVRAVAFHETGYGNWKTAGAGSHNMGAITTANPDELSFKHVDSRWDPKQGKLVEYTTWFKGYVDDDAGFRDTERHVLKANVKEALANNDVTAAVEGMYDNSYFKGVHPDRESNLEDYQNAVSRALSAITGATGEAPIVPLAGDSGAGEC